MPFFVQLAHHSLPETILAVGVMALILIGAFRGERGFGLVDEMAVGILGLALVAIALSSTPRHEHLRRRLHRRRVRALHESADAHRRDRVDSAVRRLAARNGLDKFEFPVLVMLSTLGMLLLISADNLIALYLGLELMSLALYVIAAFERDDGRSSEAGLKYFVLGALSSGMLLYGASLLYGFAGTVSFAGIAAVVSTSPPLGVIFGLVFVLAGARLQNVGRAVPHVDARRLSKARRRRSPPSSLRPPRWRRWRSPCALSSPPSRA